MKKSCEHVVPMDDGWKDEYESMYAYEDVDGKFIYIDAGGKFETSELIDLRDLMLDENVGGLHYHGRPIDDYIIDEI